jgi:serine/threonine protein kinase
MIYDDKLLERPVAIKTLHAGIDPRRLLDEIETLGRLKSKNVVQVYDVFAERARSGTRVSLIQEYIDGDDLASFLGPHVSLKQVLILLYQLSSALADVHKTGITHRDVKPNNIKINKEGVLKLYDFGLARFETRQNTVGMVGTQGFMAPELCKGGYVNFTSAVDVFSFGVTAWCLFSESIDAPTDHSVASLELAEVAVSPELSASLSLTLAEDFRKRPTMALLQGLLHRELTRDAHRATVITPTDVATLDVDQPSVSLSSDGLGRGAVSYDGYDFWIERESGDVFVNNIQVVERRRLVGSTLITLGSASAGANRVFIPFDVSHPEVTY